VNASAYPREYPYGMSITRSSLLFDLDGTLVDSAPGICASAHAACVALGYPEPAVDAFRPSIGLPLPLMLRAGLPVEIDDARLEECCDEYRRQFDVIALPSTVAFPGVPETLARWRAQGRRLAVATSKRTDIALKVLARAGLADAFELIVGGDQVARGKPAPDRALRALALLGVRAEDAAMVGDTVHDIRMACSAGVAAYGVSHGVHERAELHAAGALAVVDRFEELADYLG
jgi:phosphoglycolate phosphatase